MGDAGIAHVCAHLSGRNANGVTGEGQRTRHAGLDSFDLRQADIGAGLMSRSLRRVMPIHSSATMTMRRVACDQLIEPRCNSGRFVDPDSCAKGSQISD